VFAQIVHVQVTVRFQPVLVHLDRERSDQPQAACCVGKIRPTWVRRLISSFKRSSRLVDFKCLWCWRGRRRSASSQCARLLKSMIGVDPMETLIDVRMQIR
jgi:hypothetical protein